MVIATILDVVIIGSGLAFWTRFGRGRPQYSMAGLFLCVTFVAVTHGGASLVWNNLPVKKIHRTSGYPWIPPRHETDKMFQMIQNFNDDDFKLQIGRSFASEKECNEILNHCSKWEWDLGTPLDIHRPQARRGMPADPLPTYGWHIEMRADGLTPRQAAILQKWWGRWWRETLQQAMNEEATYRYGPYDL